MSDERETRSGHPWLEVAAVFLTMNWRIVKTARNTFIYNDRIDSMWFSNGIQGWNAKKSTRRMFFLMAFSITYMMQRMSFLSFTMHCLLPFRNSTCFSLCSSFAADRLLFSEAKIGCFSSLSHMDYASFYLVALSLSQLLVSRSPRPSAQNKSMKKFPRHLDRYRSCLVEDVSAPLLKWKSKTKKKEKFK